MKRILILCIFILTLLLLFGCDKHEHTPGDAATCGAPQVCTVCGEELAAATGAHVYEDKVVQPTTEAGGYTRHTCTACGDFYDDSFTDRKPRLLRVSFDSKGGSTVTSFPVWENQLIDQPADPTKEGYRFAGWYLGETPWNFEEDVVTEFITLTALWLHEEEDHVYEEASCICKYCQEEKEHIYRARPEHCLCDVCGTTFEHDWEGDSCKMCNATRTLAVGQLTDTLTYHLYPNGHLVLTGSGMIPDYSLATPAPYLIYADKITSVTVESGIISLGDYAFAGLTRLTSVALGDTIVDFGEHVFLGCTELTSLLVCSSLVGDSDGSRDYTASRTVPILSSLAQLTGYVEDLDLNYYPGFVKKAITFSMDDGHKLKDETFIEILNRYALKGTFNLNGVSNLSVATYAGHELGNHTYNHLDMRETIANPPTLEQCKDAIYQGMVNIRNHFGVSKVTAFVFPNGYTTRDGLFDYMKSLGITNIRHTEAGVNSYSNVNLNGVGNVSSSPYALPLDWYNWYPTCHLQGFSAIRAGMKTTVAEDYLALSLSHGDELTLLGVWGHSHEISRGNSGDITWEELRAACALYEGDCGVWKATVSDLAEYTTEMKNLTVKNGCIENPTDVTFYAVCNGQSLVIPPHSVVPVALLAEGVSETPCAHTYTPTENGCYCDKCKVTFTHVFTDSTCSNCGAAEDKSVDYSKFTAPSVTKYYRNATAAVSLTFDDAQLETGRIANELLSKHGLSGTAFFILDYARNPRMSNKTAWDAWMAAWQAIVAEGTLDIGNHSYHHYSNKLYAGQGPSVAGESYETEIGEAQALLKHYFPGERILSFGAPGGSFCAATGEAITQNGLYFNRHGSGMNDPYAASFDPLHVKKYACNKGASVSTFNSYVDTAIAGGSWYVESYHYIAKEDGTPAAGYSDSWSVNTGTVEREFCEAHFAYIGQKVADGLVWCGSFNDVAAYVTERKQTSVAYTASTEISITLSISCDGLKDTEGFDHPLTLCVEVPLDWTSVSVAQDGGTPVSVCSTLQSGRNYIYFDALPNGGDILITVNE